jgi:hypothetical protein
MLRPEDGTIRVLVQDDELGSPEQHDLRPRGVFDQFIARMRAPISPRPARNVRDPIDDDIRLVTLTVVRGSQ